MFIYISEVRTDPPNILDDDDDNDDNNESISTGAILEKRSWINCNCKSSDMSLLCDDADLKNSVNKNSLIFYEHGDQIKNRLKVARERKKKKSIIEEEEINIVHAMLDISCELKESIVPKTKKQRQDNIPIAVTPAAIVRNVLTKKKYPSPSELIVKFGDLGSKSKEDKRYEISSDF